MADFNFFLPIAKMDESKRTISGYASTPAKDSDGEIVTLDAIKAALPDYMAWGNIREMHKLSAVGTAQEANIDTKGLYLTAKIVDDVAWEKCKEGVYKGFSIGGRKLAKTGNKITEIDMTEISVVDRPANAECKFNLAKSVKGLGEASGYLLKAKPQRSPEQKALAKMAKVVEAMTKAGPPAAHDGFSLPAKKATTNASPKDVDTENNKADDDAGPCEKHGKIGCKKCAIVKRMSVKCAAHDAVGCAKCAFGKAEASTAPYGDVEYADPGYQEDGKKRYPVDTEEHIRAAWNYINKEKNAAKYGDKAGAVKAKIVAAWKKKIDKAGPPSAQGTEETKKTAEIAAMLGLDGAGFLTLGKAERSAHKTEAGTSLVLPPELELKASPKVLAKSMNTAGSLSYVFDSLRNAQRSLLMEGKREGGDNKDKALADRLGNIAKDLSAVISQKALHEGSEAITLTDADDQYIQRLLGDNTMTTTNDMAYAAEGDPLAKAILDLVKRAGTMTKAQRMEMAQEDVKKSRKAMKAAREAIEEAHKMHKAAFLAKAAKGKAKGGDDEDGDFDHVGAMEKLQKAYSEIDKARTFGKAAMGNMEKAAGRAGQSGQEAGDPQAGVYQVPAGVKNLSPSDIASASPGGNESGSQPPLYPIDSPFPGKAAEGSSLRKYAKNGQISADVAQLLLEKAQSDGELEALRRLPMTMAGGRRPMAFDTSKVFNGVGGGNADKASLNKALFEGVDVGAINSGDERAHTEASARAIGNFITSGRFGKSVFDPEFKGAAGSS